MENEITYSLNYIIESNATDLVGYTFQIFAILVACSTEMKEVYKIIT